MSSKYFSFFLYFFVQMKIVLKLLECIELFLLLLNVINYWINVRNLGQWSALCINQSSSFHIWVRAKIRGGTLYIISVIWYIENLMILHCLHGINFKCCKLITTFWCMLSEFYPGCTFSLVLIFLWKYLKLSRNCFWS